MVIVDQARGGFCSGCLLVILVLAALGATIKYWYVSVPILVIIVAWVIYRSRKTGVPIKSRLTAARAAVRASQTRLRSSPIVAENVVVVKQKRGCTCCGTGCVIPGALIALSVAGLWEACGAVVAGVALTALLGMTRALRFGGRHGQEEGQIPTRVCPTGSHTPPATRSSRIALRLIHVYRRWLSGKIGVRCRFEPSCSTYAVEAYGRYGFVSATAKISWRILRCNPLNTGPSFDPLIGEA